MRLGRALWNTYSPCSIGRGFIGITCFQSVVDLRSEELRTLMMKTIGINETVARVHGRVAVSRRIEVATMR